MRILGIDCGVLATGYAVLDNERITGFGVIKTDSKENFSSRLSKIYAGIRDVIEDEKPDITVIESLFYGSNVKTLISLAQIRGVILLASNNTRIYEVTPAEIKKAITGNGRASKQQMRYMVNHLLKVPEDVSEHIIDACACALWGEWKIEVDSSFSILDT